MSDGSFSEAQQAVIAAHPPMPTGKLRDQLGLLARVHDLADDEEDMPMIEVTTCILISILRELLEYRDRYGLIGLPSDDWREKK